MESSVNEMATTGSFFVMVLCVIRRYHVYKEVWRPKIEEDLVYFTEEENVHDRKAVAVTCTKG